MDGITRYCLVGLAALASASALKADEPLPQGKEPELPPIEADRAGFFRPDLPSFMVRIADDGSWLDEDFEPLVDDKALKAYLIDKKNEFEAKGKVPQLKLRGNPQVLSDGIKEILKIAWPMGLMVNGFDPIKRPDLMNAGEGLPEAGEYTFVIIVSEGGRVTMNYEAMDAGPGDRHFKRLIQKLELAGQKHPDGPKGLKIWMLADKPAEHPRVIDVLNALSEAKIPKIRFVEPEKK